jgi:hypothetical protein
VTRGVAAAFAVLLAFQGDGGRSDMPTPCVLETQCVSVPPCACLVIPERDERLRRCQTYDRFETRTKVRNGAQRPRPIVTPSLRVATRTTKLIESNSAASTPRYSLSFTSIRSLWPWLCWGLSETPFDSGNRFLFRMSAGIRGRKRVLDYPHVARSPVGPCDRCHFLSIEARGYGRHVIYFML